MIVPELKIADHLVHDWSERYPAGTRVIVDRFRAHESGFLMVHVVEPRLDHGHGVWLRDTWLASYKKDPKPRIV